MIIYEMEYEQRQRKKIRRKEVRVEEMGGRRFIFFFGPVVYSKEIYKHIDFDTINENFVLLDGKHADEKIYLSPKEAKRVFNTLKPYLLNK